MPTKTEPPLTRKEMVRQAMSALGTSATNGEIQNYLWKAFRANVDTKRISNHKWEILREEKTPSKIASSPSSVSQPTSISESLKSSSEVPSGKEALLSSASISLTDLQLIKGLVQRLGKENLKVLLDLLST
jgi:hypothetical protein